MAAKLPAGLASANRGALSRPTTAVAADSLSAGRRGLLEPCPTCQLLCPRSRRGAALPLAPVPPHSPPASPGALSETKEAPGLVYPGASVSCGLTAFCSRGTEGEAHQ